MYTLTEARPTYLFEHDWEQEPYRVALLEHPTVQVICGDLLAVDLPECSFDFASRCYEQADGWSWSSSTAWN
jgi:hypothetical protein